MGVYGVGGTGVVKDLKIKEYKNWEVKFHMINLQQRFHISESIGKKMM